MNLALHGIDGNLADHADSSFTADLHPDLRADFIITNPPFNLGEKGSSGWGRERLLEDARWKIGSTTALPPASNANYAWILHFLFHLAPNGSAGFVIANGALSNINRSEEVAIRRALIEAGVVDCIVSMPTKLFANTGIPVSLWFMGRNRKTTARHRGREQETLFIDARKLGHLVSRRHRELSNDDLIKISGSYHSYRNLKPGTPYADIDGFCKVANRKEIEAQGFVLTPGRYVGTPEADEDEIPAVERLAQLRTRIVEELDQSAAIEKRLRELLKQVIGDE